MRARKARNRHQKTTRVTMSLFLSPFEMFVRTSMEFPCTDLTISNGSVLNHDDKKSIFFKLIEYALSDTGLLGQCGSWGCSGHFSGEDGAVRDVITVGGEGRGRPTHNVIVAGGKGRGEFIAEAPTGARGAQALLDSGTYAVTPVSSTPDKHLSGLFAHALWDLMGGPLNPFSVGTDPCPAWYVGRGAAWGWADKTTMVTLEKLIHAQVRLYRVPTKSASLLLFLEKGR